jgi:hypothetical protein
MNEHKIEFEKKELKAEAEKGRDKDRRRRTIFMNF